MSNIREENMNEDSFKGLADEIMRILKPGSSCLLSFITIWREPVVYFSDLLKYLLESGLTANEYVHGIKLSIDNDLFVISGDFYEDNWRKFTKKSYREFGKPFSCSALIVKR
jgi:hypothetical protein